MYLGLVGPDSHPGYCGSRAQKLPHLVQILWESHQTTMQVWPLWVMERGGRKRRAEGGRKEEEGRGESWCSGRILDCSAVLRKSSKTDETSWNWHCPWEKSHISQEWVFLSIATPCTHLLALPHSVMKQPLGNMTPVRKKQAWISEQRSWGYQSAVTVCENYIFHCCHTVCVCLLLSHVWLLQPHGLWPAGLYFHGILQARILEWIANPFSRDLPDPEIEPESSCIAGRCFYFWATSEALSHYSKPTLSANLLILFSIVVPNYNPSSSLDMAHLDNSNSTLTYFSPFSLDIPKMTSCNASRKIFPISKSNYVIIQVKKLSWRLYFVNLRIGMGLPWWSSGKESAWQYRGQGFNPWSGKIPHTSGQLSLCVTTTELTCLRVRALQREATAVRSPHTTARETPCTATKTQHIHK